MNRLHFMLSCFHHLINSANGGYILVKFAFLFTVTRVNVKLLLKLFYSSAQMFDSIVTMTVIVFKAKQGIALFHACGNQSLQSKASVHTLAVKSTSQT